MSALRIFHTADWHLGKNFGNFDRTEDFRLFLDDFLDLIRQRRPDVLLISGDIFDTSMPSSAAQKLYYNFISKLSASTTVALTVITAGNHDSQRFLEAPKPLLSAMRCIIAGESAEEEAVLFEKNGKPLLGIAAVPYLREADVRSASLDFTDLDRQQLFEAGVLHRYQEVYRILKEHSNNADIPMVAMGHLFVTGARMKPDNSATEREHSESVHVGSLRNVSADAFGHDWDYIALGHIHRSQEVANSEPMFYSGSPLALSFGHRGYEHIVIEINIDDQRHLEIVKHDVRQPRRFITLRGSYAELVDGIREIGKAGDEREPLVEARLTSTEVVGDLVSRLQQVGEEAGVRVMIVRNEAMINKLLANERVGFDLSQLTPTEVFKTVCHSQNRDNDEAEALFQTFADMFAEVEAEVRRNQAPEESVSKEKLGAL